MAVAASEVVVGLGLIVAMARRRLDLDVDKLIDAARTDDAAAWICLLLPLAGALAITLAGQRDLAPRRRLDRDALGGRRVRGRGRRLRSTCSAASAERPRRGLDRLDAGSPPATSTFGLTILIDRSRSVMMLIVTGVGSLIVLYSIGYMDGDDEERRYFAYMSLFVFSMLLLVAGRQPAAPARRLGPRRPLARTC